MQDTRVEIVHGMFCDFVREEVAGKVSALGIWGDQVRFSAPPPAVLPNLGLYIYVRSPAQQPLPALLEFKVAGRDIERVPFLLPGGRPTVNLAFNLMAQVIERPMVIEAKLHISAAVPVERTFRLEILFTPVGVSPLP